MSSRSRKVEDSDSLATNTTAGDSSSSDDTSIRVQSSTKTSTPATSVLGDDKRGQSSRRRSPHKREAVSRVDGDSDSSELSELEELGSSRKKAKVEGSGQPESSLLLSTTDTPKSRAPVTASRNSSLNATTLSSGDRRSKRGDSPEVVIYVKSGGTPSSTGAAGSRTSNTANKRAGSSLATSSPLNSQDVAMKKEESDGEETEDDLVFRKDASSIRKGKGKKGKAIVESDEEKDVFVPSDGDELADETNEETIDEDFITASQLIAQQVAKNISDKFASLVKTGKGKNKEKVVTSSKKRSVTITKKTTISRRDLDKLKKEVVSGASNKGKSKKIESSDEEGDDDFVVGSADEDEEADIPISEDTDGSSDLSDVDEDGISRPVKITSKPSTKSTKQAVARAAREARKAGIKLTWWEKNEIALQQHHHELRDVWDNLRTVEVVKPVKADQPIGLTMKLLPFQLEGLYWLLQHEKGPWKGGLLADEMGMGKTIQMISLVLSDFDPTAKERTHTLILAPTVAIMQWRNEFNKFTACDEAIDTVGFLDEGD